MRTKDDYVTLGPKEFEALTKILKEVENRNYCKYDPCGQVHVSAEIAEFEFDSITIEVTRTEWEDSFTKEESARWTLGYDDLELFMAEKLTVAEVCNKLTCN